MAVDENPWASWEANFVAHLARLREARGMTQTDLARALRAHGPKFHQQTVQRIEAGERPVRLDEAFLIAKVLDVSLDSMTSPTTAASNDELVFTIDRLRKTASELAVDLREVLGYWADAADHFVALVDDLNPTPEPEAPIVKWAMEWSIRINEITTRLFDAMDQAAEVAGQSDVERQMTIMSIEVVHDWLERGYWDSQGELSDMSADELSAWIRDQRG